MKVLLAHPGTQYSYQLAKQLYERNLLYEFHTGIAYGKDHWLYKLCLKLPAPLFKKISNRFVNGVPDRFIRRKFLNELNSLVRLKLGAEEEGSLFKRNEKFQKQISLKSIAASDAVIGFDTSSLILIENCKRAGTTFFMDVSIGHPVSKSSVYRKLLELYPAWTFTIKEKDAAKIRIEEAEMRTADHIVVASHFTLRTYMEHGIDPKKISVNPYGVDAALFSPEKTKSKTGPVIKFVFVGLVDARKGVPFLLQAWSKSNLQNATLTLVGPVSQATQELINRDHPTVQVRGRISHKEIVTELPHFDVMVFPSFFEGFGLVIPEAMACGLPVITTGATCGPDIIQNGKEGYIISAGNEDELVNAITSLAADRSKVTEMGKFAREKAIQLSWDVYGRNWEQILQEHCHKKDAHSNSN